jgi:hypothetical protein
MLRVVILLAFLALSCSSAAPKPVDTPVGERPVKPRTSSPVVPEEQNALANAYRAVSSQIVREALADSGSWQKMSYLTDRIGNRLSGTPALAQAVAWTSKILKEDGLEVATEKVMVPRWVRGEEAGEILAPIQRPLALLGLGLTVGTPKRGITGEVVVVKDFDELAVLGKQAKGKIVLFNYPMGAYTEKRGTGYSEAVAYRTDGPSRAAELGAVAVLVRSVTARSLRTPHTGALHYTKDAPRIPAAAVSVEDAELLTRLVARGEPVRVKLKLGARTAEEAESANVIAELRGREKPDEIVVIGAHLDSWDVGQGAHDDGAGCVIVMQAAALLRKLGLQPRRTIRVVLFTNEENGGAGARAYAEKHANDKHVMAMETDTGAFAPRGFHVQQNARALAQTLAIASLLREIGATRAEEGFSGADVSPLAKAGVPCLGFWMELDRYFDYHHSEADTLDKIDPEDLKRDVAAVAVLAYVVADMPERFGAAAQGK